MPRLTTRDYKRSSRNASGARLKEFGLGVLVGAALASAGFLIAGAHARHAAAVARGHVAADAQSRPHAPAPDDGSNGGDAGSTSAPQADAAPAPQYDFYRMLPRFKVPVPHDDDHPSRAPAQPPAEPAAHAATPGPFYILQVGSYRSSAEAQQVRARLARAGIPAQVQHIDDGSRTWNRVRIGPLSDAQLARVRQQLRTANIHALLMRSDR